MQKAANAAGVKIETKSEEMVIADVANGPVAAAFIGAGVGAAALGLIIPLAEAIPAFKTFLTWDKGVGPLMGKVLIPSALFFVVWAVLGFMWKGKNTNMRTALTVAIVGLIIGLVGSFPPVFEAFTAK
jgi:FtsH-binding integral membrane protein